MVESKKKSKRLSWAPDVTLCQVRLFLSEDSPSQVGLGAQDHLQAKASWLLHSSGAGFDEHLPPGFEGALSSDQFKKELCQIPLVKWQIPYRFVLNPQWLVVAGEESKEVEIQKQREMRVLEAVYPRPSSIPPSPSAPSEFEDSQYDGDRGVPVIPITPIEDEDAPDPSPDSMASKGIPTSSHLPPQRLLVPGTLQTSQSSNVHHSSAGVPISGNPALGIVHGVEPDVLAAASAAFTAIMRSNEQGSLVDPELLIKILNNPKLIEKLVTDYAAPAKPPTPSQPRSHLMSSSAPQSSPFPVHMNRIQPNIPMSATPTTGRFNPVTNAMAPTLHPPAPSGFPQVPPAPSGFPQVPPAPSLFPQVPPAPSGFPHAPPPTVRAPLVKDVNYYKSLIQQHGGERPGGQDHTPPQFGNHHNYQPSGPKTEQLHTMPRDSQSRMKKPCMYFNSSRGCKNGVNCLFQHDASAQQRIGSIPEAQSAKRMKIDREITGRS